MDGYIYCFSNEGFIDNLYKIGFTLRTPCERIDELYHTNTPFPFKIEFAKKVSNCQNKEQKIHNILKKYRANPKREFFKVSLDIIRDIFDIIEGIWYNELIEPVVYITNNKINTKPVVKTETTLIRFNCDKCGASYANESSLIKHKTMH